MKLSKIVAICSTNSKLFLVFYIFIASTDALDNLAGTVVPLMADTPVSSEKIVDNKDFKKFDNDPPPEFYKGPATSSSSNNNNYDSYNDLKFNGQSHRQPGFISNSNSGYFNPYLQKHGFYGPIHPKDRVSIGGGYYSGSEFNGNGFGSGVGGGGGGGVGPDRVRPYGSPQPVDIPPNSFNPNGYGYGGPGYDGAYEPGLDGNIWPEKMNHLSKSHFIPLAGAALIGIAAALLVNPVLLQLGTISGKRRRRRDTKRQSLISSRLRSHQIAYNGHIQQ